jgi:hypothetical protein
MRLAFAELINGARNSDLMTAPTAPERTAKASGTMLITLAAAQFLMTLDSG